MHTLDAALIKAHEEEDFVTIIQLYREAGAAKELSGDIDAACFYFTHAFVFALQEGSEEAIELSRKLAEYGRETALD